MLILDFAPPCPALSKDDQEDVKRHRETILKKSPAEFKNQPSAHQIYWVYAHFIIKRNLGEFIDLKLLSKEDAEESDEEEEEEESKQEESKQESKQEEAEEEYKVTAIQSICHHPSPSFLNKPNLVVNFNSKRKMKKTYIMLHGKKLLIEEIYTVESGTFRCCYGKFDGVLPIKIESRSLQKALDFCKKRAKIRKEYSSLASMVAYFDRTFLEDVRRSNLNLIDLIHAAGRLEIQSLFDLLFEDVVGILCIKTPPEEVEKIFKVRCNGDNAQLYSRIDGLLDQAPPCPTLSKEQQEEMKLHRENILKVSPADFTTTLSGPQIRYWVYAHLVIKRNPVMFGEEDEDEEDESKVPKNDDNVGGPGPRGVAW